MSPSKEWRETVADDEVARFDRLAEILTGIQERRAKDHPLGRALHYKGHGGLLGTFRVRDGLPEWCRVGIFAQPGEFPAYVRFSNGSGGLQRDAEPDVRGLAVKVVGVPGRKIIHPDAVTQDFLAILSPAVPFATPEEFVGLVQAVSGPKLLALPRLLWAFGRRTGTILGALRASLGRRVGSMAEPTFFSALPIRWGDYAVKYSFAPVEAEPGGRVTARDGYREELQRRLSAGPVRFALRVQGFVSEAATPIEDNTKEWREEDAPWVTVADLEIRRPAPEVADAVEEYVERMVFDTWHAPEEFRPLGAMQRARNHAYRDSSIARGAAPEPDGSKEWFAR